MAAFLADREVGSTADYGPYHQDLPSVADRFIAHAPFRATGDDNCTGTAFALAKNARTPIDPDSYRCQSTERGTLGFWGDAHVFRQGTTLFVHRPASSELSVVIDAVPL